MSETREFLREGSIRIYRSIAGDGQAPEIEDYPFQSLAIEVEPYEPWAWLDAARLNAAWAREGAMPCHPVGDYRHPGYSPLGTSTAVLAREGLDTLSSPCGYCGRNIAACKCGQASGESE